MFAAKKSESVKAKAEKTSTQPNAKGVTADQTQANPLWTQLATRIQTKLAVTASDDPLEREADRVADEVVRMPDAAVSGFAQGANLTQRKGTDAAHEVALSTESRIQSLRNSGQPLSDDAKSFFEPRFGYNFSNVRVHTGSEAAQLAQAINAKAFTTGNNIVFNAGQYSSESSAGNKLLAHELTHTIQQGAVAPSSILLRSSEGISHAARTENTIQRAPGDDEKKYIIQKVTINGDVFDILLTHKPIDGNVFIHVSYEGSFDFLPRSTDLMVKDSNLKTLFDDNTYRVVENTLPGAAHPLQRVEYFPYKDRRDIHIDIEDAVIINNKWVPPRRKHRFFGSVSGKFTLTLNPQTGAVTRVNNDIEVIPQNAIPAAISEPEYQNIVVPKVPELAPKEALLAARMTLTEIYDSKDLYHLQWPDLIDKLKGEIDEKIKNFDASKDNSAEARLATGIVRAADHFKQKMPSLAVFLIPGYFPPQIADEAIALVREVHTDYEFGLNLSNGAIDRTNAYYKRADSNLMRLQYRLTNLFLKRREGGLDALVSELVSLATDIDSYRSSAGVGAKFQFLDETVLGIRQQQIPGTQFTSNTPTPASRIESQVSTLRDLHSEADLDAFTKVMRVASTARAYKSIFSMVAVYELLRFYRNGYYGDSSWVIDAVLPGSGQKTVDGYIDSVGGLLTELEAEFKAKGGVTEEYLTGLLKRFTDIVGKENFEKDLKFVVDRLNTIATVKAVVKGLLIIIAAAIGAAIIGPAAGAIAAEAGIGVTGVGLISFGAEVLAFTAISQVGNQLVFGRTDMGFFEELLHNAVMFGVLKGVARLHRLAFAKFAEPKLYPKLFAATGATTSFISLYGLGMVQHALPPALGGKGRVMTAEEQGWLIVQNIALLGAMALASKITKPIREQLDQRTFDALTANHKEKLAALEANRMVIKDEIAAVRKLGVKADPVRRQRLINAIEQQYNSDIAWFKEALRILKRHPAVLGVDKAAVERFISEYRAQVEKLTISLAENGYDFNPGGMDIVKYVEPGVLAYTGDAFKTGDVDPLTGEKREVIDLGDGNYEVKIGGRRLLYVPRAGLPVSIADPQGVRALVEYYHFEWEATKRAFGSDDSMEMNSLLHKAWRQGWRPGQAIPQDIKLEIFDHFRKQLDSELNIYQQYVRDLPEKLPPSEEHPGFTPKTRGELLSDAGIIDEIRLFQSMLELRLNKLNPDVRRGLVSLYVSKALNFLRAERAGIADTSKYPTSEEILEAAPLIAKGGLSKYPALVELLMTDREMLWLLFEFRDNPKKLLEHYETNLGRKKSGDKEQSFREYGRRFLFEGEFDRAQAKLREHIRAEREAARAQELAQSGKDVRSLHDRFGTDWKTGTNEEDRAHNNGLLYQDSEPGILQAHKDGKLPSHLSTAIDTALKGDHLAGVKPTEPQSYIKARTKVVGEVNLALKKAIKSFSDYLAIIDLTTQRAAIGRIGEGFAFANEADVGLPTGGKKVTIHLDAKATQALNAARAAMGLAPVFEPDTKWITIDLFYDSGNLIAEIKVGTSYDPLQFSRYATVLLHQKYIQPQIKAAGIDKVDGIFYLVLPGAEGGEAATLAVQERQARRIHADATMERVVKQTKIRFIDRNGDLYEQTGGTSTNKIKTIK